VYVSPCVVGLATGVFIAQSRVGANTWLVDEKSLSRARALRCVGLEEHKEDDNTGERQYSNTAERFRGTRACGEKLDSDGYGNPVRNRNEHEGELRDSHRSRVLFVLVRPPPVGEPVVRLCNRSGQCREDDGGAQDDTHQFVV